MSCTSLRRSSGFTTGVTDGEDRPRRWADGRKGRFLTSNVNITVLEDGESVSVPVADRFAKFETKQ